MPLIHPAIAPGNVAVVTGAAGGIGLAAARRCAGRGRPPVDGRSGTSGGGDALSNPEGWTRLLGVNLHGVQRFVPAMDEKRILWAAQDIIADRPALSRWHPDFMEAFAAFMRS